MSSISAPVIPASGGMRSPTGMDANGNGNGIHGHEQFRSPSLSGSVSASYSKSALGSGSGSKVGRRNYDCEPGGRGQVFGVRLVRGLPRSWTRAAGAVEGKWYQRQNWQWMERRRIDEGRERDGGSGSSRT